MRGQLIVAAILVAVAMTLAVPRDAAALTKDEAAGKIAEAYDVVVLEKKTREGEINGRPVWFFSVMRRGGDFNSAFQVTTLAVDQATGELVPAFRHKPSGYELPGGDGRGDKTGLRPDAARSRTWR